MEGGVVAGEEGLHGGLEEVFVIFGMGVVASLAVGVSDLVFEVVTVGDFVDLLQILELFPVGGTSLRPEC